MKMRLAIALLSLLVVGLVVAELDQITIDWKQAASLPFQIQVDLSKDTKQVRQKIHRQFSELPPENQVLTYNKKVLQDGQSLQSVGITPEDVIFVMTRAAYDANNA